MLAHDLAGRLAAGDVRALARAIRMVEDRDPEIARVLREVRSRTGRAHIVGVTGPPGSGKSTLCDQVIERWRSQGHRVGVIAVDPSSPFSGGAILGDRIRMQRHTPDSGVFIHGKQLQVRDYPNAGPREYAAPARPAGQWNDLEFDITGGVAVVRLNGKVIEKTWRIGNNPKQGIGLQREVGDFDFRHIRIREKK